MDWYGTSTGVGSASRRVPVVQPALERFGIAPAVDAELTTSDAAAGGRAADAREAAWTGV
jgi:hypothetical protein